MYHDRSVWCTHGAVGGASRATGGVGGKRVGRLVAERIILGAEGSENAPLLRHGRPARLPPHGMHRRPFSLTVRPKREHAGTPAYLPALVAYVAARACVQRFGHRQSCAKGQSCGDPGHVRTGMGSFLSHSGLGWHSNGARLRIQTDL